MGWWLPWLVWLALVGGLALFAGGRRRRREAADGTLIAELRDPAPPPDGRVIAAQAREEVEAAREGDWLDTQLAMVQAWAKSMQDQIASCAADLEGGWLEAQLAVIAASSERADKQIASQLAAFRSPPQSPGGRRSLVTSDE